MDNKESYLQSIHEIRSMMERSSKFLSMSGLSGIAAGATALLSGTIAFFYLQSANENIFDNILMHRTHTQEQILFCFVLASITLFVALSLSWYFTRRNAKKQQLPLWDKTAKLVVWNMAIPLFTGGLFILALVFKFELYGLVAPSMLLFYGLALVNTSKYTVSHTRILGLAEITLGLLSLLFFGYGVIFWMIGFGLFHIIYGIVLYWSFERNREHA